MKLSKLLLSISYLLIATFLLSCGGDDKKSEKEGSTETAEVDVSDPNSPEFVDKFNAYIDYFNNVADRMSEINYNYYREGEDYTPSEDNIPNVSSTPETYSTSLKEFIDKDPSFGDVDEAAKKMVATGDEINKQMVELEGYYDRKDYKSDNMKKGLDSHAKLGKLFDDFFKQYADVKSKFQSIADKSFESELERYKDEGYMLAYNVILTNHNAEKIVTYLEGKEGTNGANTDIDQLETLLGDFRTTYDEVLKYKDNDDEYKKEFGLVAPMHAASYYRAADDFIAAIRDFEERVKNNDFNYSPNHANFPDDGSVLKINEEYSDMISAYNRMAN